jgi:hypothetical protein
MTKDEKILAEALTRFKKSQEHEREDKDLSAEDFSFLAGEQWPDDVRRVREQQGRPCLTFNRLPSFVRQITGAARQNPPAIKVFPVDSGADEDTAEIYNGLIRNIEEQSRAKEIYMTAFESAVGGGIGGGWRICTEYANALSFDQEVRIKRIANPFSITWDINAREFDKRDATYCFVSEWMSKEAFELKFPKHTPTDWEIEYRNSNLQLSWIRGTDNMVRVCEYWVKQPVTKTIGLIQGQILEVTKEMRDLGIPFEQVREVESHKVIRYLLSGHAVLEGPEEFPGEHIPIIPVFGPEEYVPDRSRHVSLIRYAKDAQRMYNYWQSSITEKIALAPKAPFLATPAMVAGLEQQWKSINSENRAVLLYNADPQSPAGMPIRQEPATINQAEMLQSAQAVDDLKATMGIFDASLGNQSNETSGRAILARQREGDNATFAWIDNLARSIEQTGRILVGLIPKVYDTQRIVRILGEDDTADMVPINAVVGGQLVNDITVGRYDVVVTVGPSYRTAQIEAAESMMQFVQAMPQTGAVIADLLAKSLNWPNSDVIAERLKKLLPPGVDEESEAPPPDPMVGLEREKEMATVEGKQLDNAKKQLELSEMTGNIQAMVAQEVERVILGMMQQPEMMPVEQALPY